VGAARFYRVTRNRTAESLVPQRFTAEAPEPRRPRFSFLYVQLVKEPETQSPGQAEAPKSQTPQKQSIPKDRSNLRQRPETRSASPSRQCLRAPFITEPQIVVKNFFPEPTFFSSLQSLNQVNPSRSTRKSSNPKVTASPEYLKTAENASYPTTLTSSSAFSKKKQRC